MINKLPSWQQFPWRDGNRFQLLVDGSEIFPAMLDAINSAKSQILLEMYLIESGVIANQFVEALAEAVKRNVKVYLILDDYGARGLSQKDRRRLDEVGIFTVYYNPIGFWNPIFVWGWHRSLLRDHRKLLIIDDQAAFVGGMGITDDFDSDTNTEDFWHDVAVKTEGSVVYDWLSVFKHNWAVWAHDKFPALIEQFPHDEAVKETESTGQNGRVASGRFLVRSEIQRAFVKRVLGAKHHAWMMTAYFVPMRRLLRAMRLAAQRGVDVRLLVPGPETDHPSIRYAGRRHYHSLLTAGVRIYEYQPRFLHAKVLLSDDWASIGSSNVDRWNLRWNQEGNQEVEDDQFTQEIRELFEADFKESKECVLGHWRARPWYYRFLERFWGQVELLIESLSEKLRRHKD